MKNWVLRCWSLKEGRSYLLSTKEKTDREQALRAAHREAQDKAQEIGGKWKSLDMLDAYFVFGVDPWFIFQVTFICQEEKT